MPYLAIDTSSEYLSIAIEKNGQISARSWHVGQKHAELTLPYLRDMLDALQLDIRNLDGIAYPVGPGSFTGLRIACGIVQGLAYAANIPVVGISTLEAMINGATAIRIYSCIDARMNQVYCAAYKSIDGQWQETIAPLVCDPQAAPVPAGQGWFGLGNGFAVHGAAMQSRLGDALAGYDAARIPQAADLLALALPRFAAGEGRPAHEANLVYLRDKVALTTREREAR